MMNRRFFHREEIRANGEFVWATKSRIGRVTTNREFITTENVSVDGAKIIVPGRHHFPEHSRGRIKFGLEFCDVEILESFEQGSDTALRLLFLAPSARFVGIIEKWLPIKTDDRRKHESAWT